MEKHITIKSGQPWLFGVDVQENSGGAPEARSRLCVLSGFLPRDLFHGRDSSRWLLAGAPSHQVLCVLPQVYSSIPGVVSRPRASRPSHPLPLARALARAGAQGVLVMNNGRTRLEWGVFHKPDALLLPAYSFARILWNFARFCP